MRMPGVEQPHVAFTKAQRIIDAVCLARMLQQIGHIEHHANRQQQNGHHRFANRPNFSGAERQHGR